MTEETLWFVRGQVMRWVDNEPQPGIVEFRFSDTFGREHSFITKFYDVALTGVDKNSVYPQPGVHVCEVIQRSIDELGREIAEIDTETPARGWISEEGISRFVVFASELEPDVKSAPVIVPLIPIKG